MLSLAFSSRAALSLALLSIAAGCRGGSEPDAYGNFEANEVVVSAQASGQLRSFTPVEGASLAAGTVVGQVDPTQLELERAQVVAQKEAAAARVREAGQQVSVFEVQRTIALRSYERTRRLFEQRAATAQQRDQAERDYRVLVAQIQAAHAQQQSVGRELASSTAREAQIRDKIAKSQVINPQSGTVLATYVRAGEMVQPAQPLYRIANIDTLILRAYVSGNQLASVRLGQRVLVHVDQGDGKLRSFPGTVRWVSAKAEFTPTPVQTRDERADLVYAVKVYVANPGGELKIGMPADLELATPQRGP